MELVKEEMVPGGDYGRIIKIMHRIYSPTKEGERAVDHFMVSAPNYTGVVCRRNDGKILLIRNFRDVSGQYGWEIPAGYEEAGETAWANGAREASEEAGLIVEFVKELPTLYLETLVSAKARTFICNVVGSGSRNLDADENIPGIKWFSAEEVEKLLFNNGITDGHSYAALMTYLYMLKEGKI